jgi:predicted Fe-Mo cluster-binding NifX family protein
MKLCIPVERNEGLKSLVYDHFGSAPCFMFVDTETREMSEIINRDLHHAHGACNPLKALGGEYVDAIIVRGIGAGALLGLRRAGLKVFKAQGVTVADNLTCLGMDLLPELSPDMVCGGHGHGYGCA